MRSSRAAGGTWTSSCPSSGSSTANASPGRNARTVSSVCRISSRPKGSRPRSASAIAGLERAEPQRGGPGVAQPAGRGHEQQPAAGAVPRDARLDGAGDAGVGEQRPAVDVGDEQREVRGEHGHEAVGVPAAQRLVLLRREPDDLEEEYAAVRGRDLSEFRVRGEGHRADLRVVAVGGDRPVDVHVVAGLEPVAAGEDVAAQVLQEVRGPRGRRLLGRIAGEAEGELEAPARLVRVLRFLGVQLAHPVRHEMPVRDGFGAGVDADPVQRIGPAQRPLEERAQVIGLRVPVDAAEGVVDGVPAGRLIIHK